MSKEKVFTIGAFDYYMDRVFLEYEQPELFSVCDIIGGQYIVMLVDDCDEKWLMTPISVKRLFELEYGKIPIRDVFISPEIQQVNLIENANGVYVCSPLLPTDLSDEYLPLDDARLNWDNIPTPSIRDELFSFAKTRNRDIFDIRVISESTRDHTIETKAFATLLNILNESVSSLTKARNRKYGKKHSSDNSCTLRFAGNYDGSFGIILESSELSNLIDETQLTLVLGDLFRLLQISDVNNLEKVVKEDSFDYSSSLRKLLKFSSDNKAAMEFQFTTPRATCQGKAYWEQDFSQKALAYLDHLISNEIKDEFYVGDLVAVSTKHSNFEFITETGDQIKGKIDPSLRERKFTVRSKARIKVKKSIRITNANEIDEKYCLVEIDELDDL